MTDTKITVQRTINAPAADIFDVLTNPHRHPDLDGSGMVRSGEHADRIKAVGDVFTMDMYAEHMGGDYKTDNHVTGYDTNKLVSWQTAPAGTEPKGWEWVWELEAQGSDTTLVTLTYDWSKVTDKQLLQRVSFPVISQDQLEDSLVRLSDAVTA